MKDKVTEKATDVAKSIDDKDKKELDDQGKGIKEEAQKKASDVLKPINKVVNSPEANIIGGLAGPNVKEPLKKIQKVVGDAAKNPDIVGNNKA